MCSIAALALILWGAAALLWRATGAVTDFARNVPSLMALVSERLTALEELARRYISSAPEGAALYLETGLRAMSESVSSLPVLASKAAVAFLTRMAQASPDTLLFIFTAGLGTYFISASFPRLNAFLLAQLPESFREKLAGLGTDLKCSLGGFLRSQLILMVMTFFELLAAFLLLRIEGAAAIAAVTAIIDALPVFGTGIILVPWGLACMLLGDMRRGIGLMLSWLLSLFLRNCFQAKLLGDQIGLDPLASLVSIYVGWRVCGVWGMLLFPILLVTLCRLNDRGVVRLWRR